MNIATLQAMIGAKLQSTPNNVQTGQVSEGSFGTVLGNIVANNTAVKMPMKQEPNQTISDESIVALFNAATIEELKAIFKAVGDESEELDVVSNLGSFDQLAQLLGLDSEQLIESMSQLLEKAGLGEQELAELPSTPDFWTILNAIEKVAPSFFTGLTDALEGKGDLPKQQAIELLMLLKTGELLAPKTDLLLKQEQQIFTLQSNIAMVADRFEKSMQTINTVKPSLLSVVDLGRFAIQNDTRQAMTDDGGTSKNGLESSQQAVSGVVGAITVPKDGLTITELENRNNARNEALVREMHTIFNRSNFGQTGGTNRLLIKLYPEHLGQVRIELLQTNGIMTARILASTALGKEMLDSQLHQLRQAFVQQNLQIERIDISQTLQDTARNGRDQTFNQHFGRQQQEAENQHEQNGEEEMTFQEYLIELEV